jgi:hypothetical protein
MTIDSSVHGRFGQRHSTNHFAVAVSRESDHYAPGILASWTYHRSTVGRVSVEYFRRREDTACD